MVVDVGPASVGLPELRLEMRRPKLTQQHTFCWAAQIADEYFPDDPRAEDLDPGNVPDISDTDVNLNEDSPVIEPLIYGEKIEVILPKGTPEISRTVELETGEVWSYKNPAKKVNPRNSVLRRPVQFTRRSPKE